MLNELALDAALEEPSEAALDRDTWRISVTVTEAQAVAMAGGYVPNSVKSILRELLDYAEEDERRAARPLLKKARKRA